MDDTIVEAAKQAAYQESLKKSPTPKIEERNVRSLEPIKEKLRQGRKQAMRKCEYYLCDSCDSAIYQETGGFVIHGNIYVANPSIRGGLIGNNFPNVVPGEKIEVSDVQETVLCKKCFFQAIGIIDDSPKMESVKDVKQSQEFQSLVNQFLKKNYVKKSAPMQDERLRSKDTVLAGPRMDEMNSDESFLRALSEIEPF